MPQVVNGIYLPEHDTHFAAALRLSPMVDGKGTYQLHKLKAALPYARRRGVAVDVGAHVGLWTLQLAKRFTYVHAFEMHQAHSECLFRNCEGLTNVMVHPPVALGSGHGRISFAVEHANSGNTRVCHSSYTPSPIQIQLMPLSAFFDEDVTVDFIKIDVEGYEMQVVIGATDLIKRCKPTMVVEQKLGNAERYGSKTGEVIDLLKAWGARTVWQKSGDFCLTWE